MLSQNYYIYGWRQVPVNPKVLGPTADSNRPEIAQVLFRKNEIIKTNDLERDLYEARKKIEKTSSGKSTKKFLRMFVKLKINSV